MMMRACPLVLATAVLAATTGAATAQEMAGADIDKLVRGNTVYFEVLPGPAGAGVAPYYFGSDGRAAIKLPNGTIMRGPWKIDGNAYCTDWENGPKNSCSKLVKTADGKVDAVNPADGKPRSKLIEVKPGNPEKF